MCIRKARGVSLAELLAALFVLGLVFSMSVPALSEILAEEALATAAREVAGFLTAARARAVFQGAAVGVKWIAVAGDLVLTDYQDGNGDGVRTADIKKGVDRLVAGPYWLGSRHPGISFSFVPGLAGLVDPSGTPIGSLADPIRFGRSDICSFSPIGDASPGTVYLSNGKTRQAAVRVTPTTGRIQIWTWHGKKLKWTARW